MALKACTRTGLKPLDNKVSTRRGLMVFLLDI